MTANERERFKTLAREVERLQRENARLRMERDSANRKAMVPSTGRMASLMGRLSEAEKRAERAEKRIGQTVDELKRANTALRVFGTGFDAYEQTKFSNRPIGVNIAPSSISGIDVRLQIPDGLVRLVEGAFAGKNARALSVFVLTFGNAVVEGLRQWTGGGIQGGRRLAVDRWRERPGADDFPF